MLRRQLNQKVYWRIPRDCDGETVFIIAGGPSVSDLDLTRLKGRRVMVINSSYQAYRDADMLFFGDTRWWKYHKSRIGNFTGKIVTTASDCPNDERLLFLKQKDPKQFPLTPGADEAAMGRTSLHGAIDIAVKRGAKQIVLLGADMQPGEDKIIGTDGRMQLKTHHHEPHPAEWMRRPKPNRYQLQMEQLRRLVDPLNKRGIEVFNCSPVSLIDWWAKADFNELTRD